MEILIKAGQLILSLSILVIFHEAGHFFFAKLFKTRVEKFYLFFNPWFSLFKTKWGETEYGIGWLPLGGYVKISGMIDESMDKEQMKLPAEPWEFRSKPAWQRLLIMLGGVLVNFLLAFAIYVMILSVWGKEYLPTENVKYGVTVDSLGREFGLQTGDKIISANNKTIENFRTIVPEILLNEPRTLQIERNGQNMEIEFTDKMIGQIIKHKAPFFAVRIPFVASKFTKDSPAKSAGMIEGDRIIALNGQQVLYFDEFKSKLAEFKNKDVKVTVVRSGQNKDLTVRISDKGLLGVFPRGNLSEFFELRKIEYSLVEAVPAGVSKGYDEVGNYLKQFKLIFNAETKAYESVGGFIAIGNIFPAEWDWQIFWSMTALLSIMLAVINILPIPALDGGHVLFLFFEIISGRKPSDKFLEYAQIVGMVLLFSLLIFANGNDIVKLFN
ncbi:MAG: RIP metalloprotease RseP [Bacteroidetes bacterium 4572_117]|nr:MAG: RIP metalloprotease RseP [Bacteroidetes bacterium 4572_117]